MTNNKGQKEGVQEAKYCLYARKSSEQDERQALSIDAQAGEVLAMAARDGLEVVDERRESHSAKDSGRRPVFNKLLEDVAAGTFNAILTWAPDRLSRNGGDLGRLVDLMDQGKLLEIRTPSQRFTNSPNEKFLLMILCSQAKLENDNKSVNVKRGLRAKVKMGYRPNMAPLGYLHDTNSPKGERKVYLDPERASAVTEAFHKVADEGWSGRRLKIWFDDEKDFTTRTGKRICLAMIYRMMENSYYTGRFEFPKGSGKFYQGKYEPIIDQKTFDLVQERMKGTPRKEGPPKEFAFTKLLTCGECGSGISADEKRKRLKDGTMKRYIYYGCNGKWQTGCSQRYVREEKLIEQVIKMMNVIKIDRLAASKHVKSDIERIRKTATLLGVADVTDQLSKAAGKLNVRSYAKCILKKGSREEKREILDGLKSKFILRDSELQIAN
ncbi:recombinase family protein [Patescibacteria group bacterium]